MPLSDDDIREILCIIDQSELTELRVETDEFSLHVIKGPAGATLAPPAARSARTEPAPAEPASQAQPESNGALTIDAPMLGTFYRAESPGAPPFVEPGTPVEPDTVVCIIEVMKMMNSVPAGVRGVVTEVLAENAALVEYGAPLFRVKPQ
jgi:acetyl-CoA carboxylase biotin carboxyl carrier protein